MPRTGPRRLLIAFKLSEAGREAIDKLATERNANRSETIRVMLAYASQKMPKGWKP